MWNGTRAITRYAGLQLSRSHRRCQSKRFTFMGRDSPGGSEPVAPNMVDYIFHTKDFQTLSAWVLDKTGSNHRPLLIDLELLSHP
jgi:endonuclease/exonuclease/phosphatase (EEP) superfamily protein YafD